MKKHTVQDHGIENRVEILLLGQKILKLFSSFTYPTKWTHLGAVSATVGVTLLHIIKIFLIDGLYFVI